MFKGSNAMFKGSNARFKGSQADNPTTMPPNNTSFAYATNYGLVMKSLSWMGWHPTKRFNFLKATPGFLSSFVVIMLFVWSAYDSYRRGQTPEALTLVAGVIILKVYNVMFIIIWYKSKHLVRVFDQIDALTNDSLKESDQIRTNVESCINLTKKLTKLSIIAPNSVSITLPIMWLVAVLIHRNKGHQDGMYVPFSVSLPGGLHNFTPYNEIANGILCFSSVFACVGHGGWNGIIFSYMIFLKCQFDVICFKVKDLFCNLGPENYEKRVMEKLAEIVERHQKIIRLKELIENSISVYILMIQVYMGFIMCVCAFIILDFLERGEGSIQAFCILPLTLFITFVLCKLGTEMRDANTNIGMAAYNCDWESYPSAAIRRTLMIIIMRSQSPIQMTGFRIAILNLGTFSMIVNTAYTYFTFLRST